MDLETRVGEEPEMEGAGPSRPARPLDADWCGLTWTPWVTLKREAIRRAAPRLPGLYRIRREGNDLARLTYVGQTGRGHRERLLGLAAGANAEICPFNDPHTAAPHLWLLRQQDGAQLAISCAAPPGDEPLKRAVAERNCYGCAGRPHRMLGQVTGSGGRITHIHDGWFAPLAVIEPPRLSPPKRTLPSGCRMAG